MTPESLRLIALSLIILTLGMSSIKSIDIKSSLPYVLSALGLIGLLIAFYMNASNIDYEDFGTPAQFGQLGDYFGGILNPIFGFITIMLVLHSARLQRQEMKSNKTIRDIESVERLIEKTKESLSERLNNNILKDNNGLSFDFQSAFDLDVAISKGHRELIYNILFDLQHINSFEMLEKLPDATINHWHIFNIRHDFRHIILLLLKRLELEDFEYSKSDIASEILFFIQQRINMQLATDREGELMRELTNKYNTGIVTEYLAPK
jgi:uncharacterized membrane protein